MKKIAKDMRTYFVGIYSILNIVLMIQLMMSQLFPIKYLAIIAVVLLLLWVAMWYLQYNKKTNRLNRILGKVLLVILSVLMMMGNLYLYKTSSTFRKIADQSDKKIVISLVVMKDSPYEKVKDLEGSTIATSSIGDRQYTDKAIQKVEKELNGNLVKETYDGFDVLAESLYQKESEAILLNEGFRGMMEENHPNFDEETRVIATYTYKEKAKEITKAVDVTKEPFVVYISGIDTYGSISTVSRSDVNKLMIVNPTSKQILLIDIPRDYYIPQTCQGNQCDKLTHTGIFGIECSVESLSSYLGIDINYYMRVNFSSLVNIVDALGGINVDSDYAFYAGGYQFNVGTNTLYGEAALAFSRERYSLPGGDNSRIVNQSRVLTGIINKATSPAIITNYMSVLDAVAGTFQTNMSENDISSLINMQLNEMSGWNISNYALKGTGGTDWTPANGFNAYVMYPDETSVANAISLMESVKLGNIPVIPEN